MTTLLIRPDNWQPAAILGYRDGMVALDTTCITPAKRWYTLQSVQTCNPTVNVYRTWIDAQPLYTCAEPPPMVIFPMPMIHTKAVFLALANYALYLEMCKVNPHKAQLSAKEIVRAESEAKAA